MDNSNGLPPTAADAAVRVKDSAAAALDATKTAAEHKLAQGAERLSGSAENAASTLRRAAADVGEGNAWLGVALRKSADGLETAAQALSGGDVSRIVHDVNGFARRQPTVFLGASVALGFILARVGKTAIENATDSPYTPPQPINMGP